MRLLLGFQAENQTARVRICILYLLTYSLSLSICFFKEKPCVQNRERRIDSPYCTCFVPVAYTRKIIIAIKFIIVSFHLSGYSKFVPLKTNFPNNSNRVRCAIVAGLLVLDVRKHTSTTTYAICICRSLTRSEISWDIFILTLSRNWVVQFKKKCEHLYFMGCNDCKQKWCCCSFLCSTLWM